MDVSVLKSNLPPHLLVEPCDSTIHIDARESDSQVSFKSCDAWKFGADCLGVNPSYIGHDESCTVRDVLDLVAEPVDIDLGRRLSASIYELATHCGFGLTFGFGLRLRTNDSVRWRWFAAKHHEELLVGQILRSVAEVVDANPLCRFISDGAKKRR